jgi:hypothetical protein
MMYSLPVPPSGTSEQGDAPPDQESTPPSPDAGGTGGPPPAGPRPAPAGPWLAIAAAILGVLGGLLLLVPLDLTGLRGYLALVLALPGLAVGIIGWTGRRGWVLAAAGTILCVIALVAAAVMLISPGKDPNAKLGPDDQTNIILRDDLDVRLGELHLDPDEGPYVTVTLHNKGPDVASFELVFEQLGDSGPCETGVSVRDLLPGASYQEKMGSCSGTTSLEDWSIQLTKVTKA